MGDRKYKPNLDWNHAWGAVPANIIPRFLMGVRPVGPGGEKVLIAPQPGTLAQAGHDRADEHRQYCRAV